MAIMIRVWNGLHYKCLEAFIEFVISMYLCRFVNINEGIISSMYFFM